MFSTVIFCRDTDITYQQRYSPLFYLMPFHAYVGFILVQFYLARLSLCASSYFSHHKDVNLTM
ncbi:hypothetical protein DN756_08875 [Yersinia pseudotuberculosis]|nr:hypothetical protein [Yersinia pseudotuberculosis]EIQ88836.1 putative membrane protein [Yersinia pestis PY-02]EIS23540.1 hypothetical protein YPPY54_2906 [Yersinia pestis PY-54]EIS41050.1 putative membrane protein [Yersinia pestis PY-58]EIS94548.1 putative membrane protein [Yersinia pestis PY-89]EIT57821.1 putative membrane protein [Yersinia pestis PY-103]